MSVLEAARAATSIAEEEIGLGLRALQRPRLINADGVYANRHKVLNDLRAEKFRVGVAIAALESASWPVLAEPAEA
jgi:hypothetical protein